MVKFKYNFSKWFYIVAGVGSLVAIACIILNVIRYSSYIQKGIDLGFYDYLSLGFTLVLSLAFIAIVVSALISSNYVIMQDKVVLKWGVVRNTVKLNEVKEIKLCTDTLKLQFIFEDDSYFNIVIKNSEYESFVDEVKKVAPKIVYVQGATE